MNTESAIYDIVTDDVTRQEGFYDFKLLKITSNAVLYRASKAGKYFLVKTTKDNSELQLRMLRREYELSIGCDHPHIVHIYTIEEHLPVGVGIVMEFVDGCTLADYLQRPLTKAERERIFEELLSAVGYLHKRGIVHNDLKPENILVTNLDNTLKIIDFGLADSDAEFVLCKLGCTPRYASPELRERGRVDARSDIYSIGVLMHDIFGGRHRSIAKRCMRQLPDDRYENIAALQRAWRSRNRVWRVMLVAVAVLLFVAPMVLLWRMKMNEAEVVDVRTELLATIEREVNVIYEAAADSVSRAPYREFADNHINHFALRLAAYMNEHIITIESAELNAVAVNAYTLQVNRCYESLMETASLLNSIRSADLSVEERDFYNALLKAQKPYLPYSGE